MAKETGAGDQRAPRESSARRLLRALIDAKKRPERFDETCSAWDEMSAEALLDAGFTHLAEGVFAHVGASVSEAPGDAAPLARVREVAAFSVDRRGVIVSIDERARALLAVGTGDLLADLMEDVAPALDELADGGSSSLIELFGVAGERRLGRISVDPSNGRFRISIVAADISPLVEGYLRWVIGLTASEVEIIRLLLQRASTTEIAEERRTTLNTTRTHINSIIRKMKCRSVTEVVASVYELSLMPLDNSPALVAAGHGGAPARGVLVSLPGGRAQIEYSRHGDPGARPLVILHSIEYGAHPSPAFLAAAAAHGYCVYVPYRPGYARSTPARSTDEAADMLTAFLERLQLEDVTLVMISAGTPVGLKMTRTAGRISRAVCVNFLLSAENKIEFARPKWIRGLLQLAARSGSSFAYAHALTRRMLRFAGPTRFYEAVYAGSNEDLAFVRANKGDVAADADLMASVSSATLREDMIETFVKIADIEAARAFGPAFKVVFGENSHGVSQEQLERSARDSGVEHFIFAGTGRNCAFQQPEIFFRLLEEWEKVEPCGVTRLAAST